MIISTPTFSILALAKVWIQLSLEWHQLVGKNCSNYSNSSCKQRGIGKKRFYKNNSRNHTHLLHPKCGMILCSLWHRCAEVKLENLIYCIPWLQLLFSCRATLNSNKITPNFESADIRKIALCSPSKFFLTREEARKMI